MAPGEIDRIEKMVARIEETVNTMRQVVFHLDAENIRHNGNIDELFNRVNATDRDFAGFRGKVTALGAVGGLLSGAIAGAVMRLIGGNP
jgi:hypothetical protein